MVAFFDLNTLQAVVICLVSASRYACSRVGEEFLNSKFSICYELYSNKQNINYRKMQVFFIHTLLITNEI
jgi:hypothetical protein